MIQLHWMPSHKTPYIQKRNAVSFGIVAGIFYTLYKELWSTEFYSPKTL